VISKSIYEGTDVPRVWTICDADGHNPRVVTLGEYAGAVERAALKRTKVRLYSLDSAPKPCAKPL
jgi:hypothetical protein